MARANTESGDVQRELPARHCNVHELFEQQATRTPDAIAVVMGNRRLSYCELNARANRLARLLQKEGAQAGAVVAVYLDRSVESVISLLATLKSGAVYLPLDPKLPSARLAFTLEDAKPLLRLTHPAKQHSLPQTGARVVLLDEEETGLTDLVSTNLGCQRSPAALAYLMYTSGSTGKPKGVMIPERALRNLLCSMADKPGMQASDVLLATTTVSFDISILELLLPLVTGGQIVMASWEQATDPSELARLLQEHAVTVMQATPTTWRMLVESGWQGKNDLKILCGGEALASDLARQLLSRCRELWNMYGPTETTIWSATDRIASADEIPLGAPIADTQLYVVDENLRPVSPGACGELLIGGTGLAKGYWNQPELTAKRFVPDSLGGQPGARLYRTGDEVRLRADGSIEFIGRLDHQVKLRGFRIELGDIEAALMRVEGIRHAVVVLREMAPGEKRLVAYYTGPEELPADVLSQTLKLTLSEYMIPSAYVRLEKFPLTANGKIDRNAFPAPAQQRPNLANEYVAPRSETEKRFASLWCEILHVDCAGVEDSFFDLGGTSIEAARMAALYQTRYERKVPVVKVFEYPTISGLCRYLEQEKKEDSEFIQRIETVAKQRSSRNNGHPTSERVALIGMVGRFPGASDLEQLWHNLVNRVESISFFKREELGLGIEEQLRNDPDYIPARGILEGAELFDAAYFGINPLEAKIMDPQQRVFLELAQQALENAGYDPVRYKGRIGVFAGIGDNHYYSTNLLSHPDLLAMAGRLAVEYGNEKDYIALRVAYLLDLRGPALSINTACSTSLTTIDQAYNNLLNFECDIALAGGIDICVPQKSGFLYQEGGTFAKDGHCRPFDAEATGTMFCDGAGIVVLKRYEDAVADGDMIYAVLCGSAKNNNGARPASFLAPSVEGQAEVIAMAQARAGVPVESIRYIEAHGTGTPVGDPIEFEALCKVFQAKTDRKRFCHLGSIKGNIGHPTNAAGVAGLIKAALVLHREEIPPTMHFQNANPKMDVADSPFEIADRCIPFPRSEEPRRAAVSSFGFGGTNVHMILEEAPVMPLASASRPMQLVLLSSRTPSSLTAYGKSFAEYFASSPMEAFADAAYTLQVGRKQMAERKFVVAANPQEAAQLLTQPNPLRCGTKRCERRDPPVVFLFGGQGTQYVNMGHNLYQGEKLFRQVVDECCEILKPHLGRDLRELLYPRSGDEESARESLQNTFYTQPAIFVMEYALTQLWKSFGVRPSIMVGHSIGEFVAATLAGVWDLQDALRIIAVRGRLMQGLPRGSMLAVGTAAENLESELPPAVQIASVNGPSTCVVSGPIEDVAALQKVLETRNLVCRQLHTSHAFHSAMMDPIVEPLRQEVAKTKLRAPQMPIVSTVTGQPITAVETTDPGYWSRHARASVRFADAVHHVLQQGHELFLECGPRATLCALVRQQRSPKYPCQAIPTGTDTSEGNAEWAALLFAMGSLWQNGVALDWDAFYANEKRRRIPLPTYPFERQRYWVEPAVSAPASRVVPDANQKDEEQGEEVAATGLRESQGSARTRKERLEVRLREIIAPVSGREPSEISSTATLLEQGFDSISLVQVAFAIRKEFGVKVSFTQLMHEYPNLEMIATHLDQAIPPEQIAVAAVPPVPPGEKANSPLSSAAAEAPVTVTATLPQHGIYSSSQFTTQLSAAYNESMTLRLQGEISVPKLARALERVVERHEALRTSFSRDGSVMKMHVLPELRIEVPVTDLSVHPEQERETLLQDVIACDVARAFPLPEGPLFRAQIILLSQQSAAVLITAHHVICDGWSLDVLVHDLCAFYSEEVSGKTVPLEAPANYCDYVQTVNSRIGSPEYEQARDYWHKTFAQDFPVLALPTDRPRASRRDFSAGTLDHRFPPNLVADLRKLASSEGCSFFAVVLGGLSLLLARVARQSRFVLAIPFADQPTIGQPGLVGHCVSLLPFVVELRDGEAAVALLRRIQAQVGQVHEHAGFSLLDLTQDLRREVPLKGISPTPVGLTSTRRFEPHELPQFGFSVTYDYTPKAFESFECYLNAVESSDGLTFRCQYGKDFYERSTVESWLNALEDVYADLAREPGREAVELTGFRPNGHSSSSVPRYVLRSRSAGESSKGGDQADSLIPTQTASRE